MCIYAAIRQVPFSGATAASAEISPSPGESGAPGPKTPLPERVSFSVADRAEKRKRSAHFRGFQKRLVARGEAGYSLFPETLLHCTESSVRARENRYFTEGMQLLFPPFSQHIQAACHARNFFGDKNPLGQCRYALGKAHGGRRLF